MPVTGIGIRPCIISINKGGNIHDYLCQISSSCSGAVSNGHPASYQRNGSQRGAAGGQNRTVSFCVHYPGRRLAGIGFVTPEEAKAATLGSPYEQYTITPEALNSYKSGMRLASLISTTNTWLFPVMVGGVPRSVLEVTLVNSRWEAASLGGTFLATRLNEMRTSTAALLSQKGVSSSQNPPRFVRIFQALQDFMVIETATADYLQPVVGNPNLNLLGSALYTPDQVIPQLKVAVQKSIQNWNEQVKKRTR